MFRLYREPSYDDSVTVKLLAIFISSTEINIYT